MNAQALLSQDALTAAPKLLGWEILSHAGGQSAGGIIVEVEAYHGILDPASHAYRGRTPRTAPMFEAAGVIYVYQSYGIHRCLNLVTGPAGEAQAILIRALEPTIGLDVMSERRRTTTKRLLTSGPGRLGQALGLELINSGTQLGDVISLKPPTTALGNSKIITTTRVGISTGTDLAWRFYIKDNPFISRA